MSGTRPVAGVPAIRSRSCKVPQSTAARGSIRTTLTRDERRQSDIVPVSGVTGMSLDVVTRGAGPALLLIHGTGATSAFWGEAADRLADRCQVMTYDRRGSGRSSNRPTAHHDVHAEDAAAIIRALNVGPVTVLGWSMGGIVALCLAHRHPELVRGAVAEFQQAVRPAAAPGPPRRPPAITVADTRRTDRPPVPTGVPRPGARRAPSGRLCARAAPSGWTEAAERPDCSRTGPLAAASSRRC